MTHHQVKCLLHTNRAYAFFHLQLIPSKPHPPNPLVETLTQTSAIQQLLIQSSLLFTEPKTLPPPRTRTTLFIFSSTPNPPMFVLTATPTFKSKRLNGKQTEWFEMEVLCQFQSAQCKHCQVSFPHPHQRQVTKKSGCHKLVFQTQPGLGIISPNPREC